MYQVLFPFFKQTPKRWLFLKQKLWLLQIEKGLPIANSI
jgi:hypothetical protein